MESSLVAHHVQEAAEVERSVVDNIMEIACELRFKVSLSVAL